MEEQGAYRKPSLYGAVRFLTVFGTLGILVALSLYLLSHAFEAGVLVGIRSLAALLLPVLAGSFVFVVRRSSLQRVAEMSAGIAFFGSLLAGAVVMASLRYLARFSPIPLAEILVASCASVLVFASGSLAKLVLDVPQSSEDRSLALFYGVASGMLLYIVLFGFPCIGSA